MDIKVGYEELTKEENLSARSISIIRLPEESCDIMDRKNLIDLTQSSASLSASTANGRCSLGPVTLDSNPKNINQAHELSPLRVFFSPLNVPCFHSCQNNHLEDSPRTPKENVFDPFAPGPDKLMLAPHRGKCMEESRTNVVRRLNFKSTEKVVRDANHEDNKEETNLDEEKLFEFVYDTLLEAIISERANELVARELTQVSGSDGFKTPTCVLRLSGVADTCPGAPVKSSSKLRHIDKGLCRRLEF